MQKEILILEPEINCGLSEIYTVFYDVIYDPSENTINTILSEYAANESRTLYGYFFDKKLIGIIGIEERDVFEILHFGIHPSYRGQGHGTELMDYIRNTYTGKKLFLTTADDAVVFYQKYGFTTAEFYEEKNGEKIQRFSCEL